MKLDLAALCYLRSVPDQIIKNLIDEDGLVTLTIEMDSLEASYVTIYWYYMPTEDLISPLRYEWDQKPILENAIYGYDDEVLHRNFLGLFGI